MAEISLGDRTFVVREPSLRRAMEWRKRLRTIIDPILPYLPGFLPGTLVDIGKEQAADLGLKLAPVLLDSPDMALDLTLAYWPELEVERDYILDNATSSQMLAALMEVLKSAYPFGQMAGMVTTIASNGADPKQTA